MKKKNAFKRFFVFSMFFLLLFMMAAGCTTKTGDSPSDLSTTTAAVSSSTSTVSSSTAATTTLPTVIDDGSKLLEISLMIGAFQGGGWPDNNHPTVKLLNEKFNIDLRIQWIPHNNKNEQLQVLAASNKLPDLYSVDSIIFSKWQKEGVFMDLMPYLNEYTNLKEAFQERMWALINPKDKRFGIPYWNLETPFGLAIRKDWLDNVGISVPDPASFTIDKFYEIAKAFALNDPNKSGKNDTVGFNAIPYDNAQFLWAEPIMAAFDLAQPWKNINGELVPMQIQAKELKEFLSFMNRAYQEGVLDKDFVTHDWSVPQTQMENGILGIQQIRATRAITWAEKLRETEFNSNAEMIFIDPPKSRDGSQALRTMASGDSKIVINGKLDKMKQMRILKLLDWWVTDEGEDITKHGIEGVHYIKKADNTIEATKEYTDGQAQLLNTWFFRRVDPLFSIPKWTDTKTQEFAQKMHTQFFEFALPNDALGIVNQSQTALNDLANIDKEFMAAMLEIIVGRKSIDNIDNAIQVWKENGGDKIIKEVNELFKQY